MSDSAAAGTTLYFYPRHRKSPFFEATQRAGCQAYGIYNHMYLPARYDEPVTEYWSLVNDVTLWDVAVERVVEITGPDASEFTNRLTPRDLTKCAVGQCKYVFITAADGGIINDPVLLRVAENQWWLALADSDAGLWARGVAVNSGLDVAVAEPEVHPLQVQGPKSKAVMAALFGEAVLEIRYYWCREADLDGIPVVIGRSGWTGELGYEIYLRDPSRGEELWQRIMEAGAPHDIRPIGPCEARRVEAGIFNYGADITLENNPFELTGLERLVEDQAADYVGKEALLAIKAEGVRRKLVGITFEADEELPRPSSAWPALAGGVEVGRVTAAVRSPRLEQTIGFAWLPIALAGPGTQIEVATPVGERAARTTTLPFLDAKKLVPKA